MRPSNEPGQQRHQQSYHGSPHWDRYHQTWKSFGDVVVEQHTPHKVPVEIRVTRDKVGSIRKLLRISGKIVGSHKQKVVAGLGPCRPVAIKGLRPPMPTRSRIALTSGSFNWRQMRTCHPGGAAMVISHSRWATAPRLSVALAGKSSGRRLAVRACLRCGRCSSSA